MSRWRLVAGVGVVAALAATLIVLSLRGDSSSPSSTTTTLSAGPTTTAISSTTTTTTEATTLTTTAEQRLAEVEELLGDLWFGWFDAIYRKDPDALWQVVATTRNHEAGVDAIETLAFKSAPSGQSFAIENLEVLLDRPTCLVVFYRIDVSPIIDQAPSQFVSVMWPDPRYGFRFATDWRFPNDLWLGDCDNLERETTP